MYSMVYYAFRDLQHFCSMSFSWTVVYQSDFHGCLIWMIPIKYLSK